MTNEVLSKNTHVFAIDNVRKSANWGRSWSQWREAYTPEIEIPFYSNSSKNVTVDIYSGDVKVNTINITANKGYNKAIFDLSFSKKGKRDYEKANKKANKKANINKAANDIYYLPKGKYTVKIGDAESEFEIK